MAKRGPTTNELGLGYEWQQLCIKARTVYDPMCHLCKKPIDVTLPPLHKMAWTLDHLDPRAVHGAACPSIERTRPAHRSCNSKRNGRRDQVAKPVKLWRL